MSVQSIYNQYKETYPSEKREVIIDKMLDDGVITFEDAKNLREYKSLFSFTKDNLPDYSKELSTAEIMGGYFNTKNNPETETPETNFNKKIEPTNQPMTQGDCWLLSELNALRLTNWGTKAIENAIIPDTDGSGGVTIKFEGSPLAEKEIYITAEEIAKARESGNYVKEDDDVIALELATEKTFREMVKLGLAKDTDERIESMGGIYRSFIFGGVETDEYKQFPFCELLGLENRNIDFSYLNERKNADNEKQKIFSYISKNKDISVTCSFSYIFGGWGDENTKDHVHGGHAYTIKAMTPNKEVVLIDPHYSDYEIKLPYGEFYNMVRIMTFSFKNDTAKQNFENIMPKNFDDYCKRSEEFYTKQDEIRAQKSKEAFTKARELNLRGEEFTKFYNEYLGPIKSFEEE